MTFPEDQSSESRSMSRTEARRKVIFSSPGFQTETSRILGIEPERTRLAVEALLDAEIIPRVGDTASIASSKDAALLLAACASPPIEAKAIVSAAHRALAMEFECDYGKDATADRRGARLSTEWTEKDRFGTQLSTVLRIVCARDEDGELSPKISREVGATIGGTAGEHLMGALHFDLPDGDVSFLYADYPVFRELHPGVTLTRLNFGFTSRFDVSPYALRRFGRLIRDVGDIWQEDRGTEDAELFTYSSRHAMLREGWGIFDAGNGRQTIQKLDDDRAGRLRTDEEAVDHVRSMAAVRSPLHTRALRVHYTEVRLEGETRTPRPQPAREQACT